MVEITDSTIVPGLKVLRPSIFEDHRGQYVETFNVRDYRFLDDDGAPLQWLEDDISVSHAGVLRGLHGDRRTWKLVQCLRGEILLAVVDMRAASPAHRRWQSLRLDDRARRQVLIPAGCANGHYAFADCIFSYKQTQLYRGAEHQFTVRWNDPSLGIEWPTDDPVLSVRDAAAPDLPPFEPTGRGA
ncbi:MAG: dTDP-4-dehydrorhamnose 3,5-epimerase [Acidobacteriota bacterium]